ncbi:chemokine vCXCL7 [Cercopithecine betaherpesvirus 5]|uniref:Chemokine vCXCL7 n=1 Tax=Simian cytomegalovirus (strain Colburn) TaxID=50292 RepID=G8XU22_SCMVC|nr:chemokine vCXCL7 [Cercopithecine betaherpesvirus 5]
MKALYNPRFLGVALLLMSLIAYCQSATELRCQCTNTQSGIHPKNIQSLEIRKPGATCPNKEVIATLKNGQKVCLNPEAPMVKNKILKKN